MNSTSTERPGFIDWLSLKACPAADLWFALGALAVHGTAGLVMGIVLYDRLLRRTSMEFSSTSLYLVTFFAVMWRVIDGEKFPPMNFISMVLILTGVL